MLQPIDWALVFGYCVFTLILGVSVARRAGLDSVEYFGAGRSMAWWLLGFSMVATTFSTDTPNLVADIVRKHGAAGNWLWWAFLLNAMMTVFVFAQLWRRSRVLTDVEFCELRYDGKPAAFLRGFRAVYLGLFLNVIVIATVSLAAIKIGRVLFNLSPMQTIFLTSLITVVYSALGGLRGIVLTDFIHFIVAMIGTIIVAVVAVSRPEVGGLAGLLAHQAVQERLHLLPDFSDTSALVTVFAVPLLVQWWATFYPGAEPGGGGYLAQRMLAAKNEKNAMGAMFFFSVAHYALRPWPWIIVALCSLVLYPDLDAMRAAFPHAADVIEDDMGYPAMLTLLPTGVLGVVAASLIAVYMSTVSTLMNWGASYIVHDFYGRFLRPRARERELVNAGRTCTAVLMALGGLVALLMQNALGAFSIILEIGAGTGLVYMLRWYWWRVNAWSEISAMLWAALSVAWFRLVHPALGFEPLNDWQRLTAGVAVTTAGWIAVTYLTRPTQHDTLVKFIRLVRPGGPGWRRVRLDPQANGELPAGPEPPWRVPLGLWCTLLGCLAVYGAIFATGYFLYGWYLSSAVAAVLAVAAGALLVKQWNRLIEIDAVDASAEQAAGSDLPSGRASAPGN